MMNCVALLVSIFFVVGIFDRIIEHVYLKSNRLISDWIALEDDVDKSFEGPECSSINRLDAVVGQHQVPQRRQTSKSRRRQPRQPVVPQVKPCQSTQSAEGAILDVDYGVAGEIEVDKRVKSMETANVDAGKLVVAEVEHLHAQG